MEKDGLKVLQKMLSVRPQVVLLDNKSVIAERHSYLKSAEH